MNKNAQQVITLYCQNEIQSLMKSNYLSEINSLSNSLGYSVNISVGEARDRKKNKYPKVTYLSISILDNERNIIMVNELDFEHLTDATRLIEIDRKNRVSFFSWQEDDDFIDSLKWFIRELKKI